MEYIDNQGDTIDTSDEPYMIVKSIIRLRKITVRELSNRMDVAEQSVSKMLNGSRKLTDKTLVNMSEALDVPFDMLRYGKNLGPYLNSILHENLDKVSGRSEIGRFAVSQKVIILPYFAVSIRPALKEVLDTDHQSTIKVIVPTDEDFSNDVVFEVNGDAMEPRLSSGFRIRCKLVDSAKWANMSSGVYAIHYNDSLVIKRVKNNDIPSNGYLTLHSDNLETGGSFQVPIAQIINIWRAVQIVEGAVY